jgi:hypothetical protein
MYQGWDICVAKAPKKVDQWPQLDPRYAISHLRLCVHLGTYPSQDTLLQEQGYPMSGASNSSFPNHSADIDLEAMGDIPLVGIFMHGGGYCHMSAEEKSPTSKIPRRLTKVRATLALAICSWNGLLIVLPGNSQDGRFTEIYCTLPFSRPFRRNFTHANPPIASQLSNTGCCTKARSRRPFKTQQPFTTTS